MERREFDEFRRQMRNLPTKQVAGLVTAGVTLAILGWLGFTSYYTIQADEVGVVQRFGRYTGSPSQPGFHWKLPLGIDRVTPVRVNRVHTTTFGFRSVGVGRDGRTAYQDIPKEAIMLTGDQNVVSVEWIVQYKIKDPAQWLFRIKDPEESIRDVSEATMRLVVGDSSATEVLTTRRREIADEVKQALQSVLDEYNSGVDIQTVELQNVIPPTKEVQNSFNDVNRARQAMETTINVANREYNEAIPRAEGEARRLVQEAEGYKLRRVNEARGDVAKFEKLLGEYQNAKEVTRSRLYLEALEEVLPKLTHIYVLDEGQSGPLQVLDLKDAGAAARRALRSDPDASQRSGKEERS